MFLTPKIIVIRVGGSPRSITGLLHKIKYNYLQYCFTTTEMYVNQVTVQGYAIHFNKTIEALEMTRS